MTKKNIELDIGLTHCQNCNTELNTLPPCSEADLECPLCCQTYVVTGDGESGH